MSSSSDPASLLHKHVRIHSVTAKPALNDKIGVAQTYIPDRDRYLVSLPPHISPSPVALRADNLAPASFAERARGKIDEAWGMMNFILQDERVREGVRRAYTSLDQRLPPNVTPQHVGGVLLLLLFGLIYNLGLARTLMLLSLIGMGVVVALPDILDRRDVSFIAKNFPSRFKDAIEQNTGYSPTQNVSNAILVVLLLVSGKVLLTSSGAGGSTGRGGGGAGAISPWTLEEVYKLGYQDAQNNKPYGENLPSNHETMHFPQYDYADFDSSYVPPPTQKGSKIGFGTIMALFALGRTIKELGFVNGRFEPNFFVANARNLPPMKIAFLAFMAYRVLSAFT